MNRHFFSQTPFLLSLSYLVFSYQHPIFPLFPTGTMPNHYYPLFPSKTNSRLCSQLTTVALTSLRKLVMKFITLPSQKLPVSLSILSSFPPLSEMKCL